MTETEKKLWRVLKNRNLIGFKFRRQHPVGKYVVDFVSLEANLVIEIDGLHHQEQYKSDDKRSDDLKEMGFTILRFWNSDINNNFENVKRSIYGQLVENMSVIYSPSPYPLPGGERGQT